MSEENHNGNKPTNCFCIHCNTHKSYDDDYDAGYCPKCLYWTELICPDRKCEFCKNRPKYPKGKLNE